MNYVPKVIPLNADAHTPELILNRTTAKLDRIKAVIVVMVWDDDSVAVDWSKISTSQLCMAAMALQEEARRVFADGYCEDPD